jgi:hypothetical protein
MRSCADEARLFFSQLKQTSSLVRVSGTHGKVTGFSLDARVVDAGLESFRVKGRGCTIALDLTGSEFEYMEPRELPEGDLRSATERMFESIWSVTLPEGDLLTVAPILLNFPA